MGWVGFARLCERIGSSWANGSAMFARNGARKLTIGIIVGGSAKTMIITTIHTLLFDSAYARSAEKA